MGTASCDFGSCKLGIFYGKKKTGTIIGTIPFIAPEVITTVHFTRDSCIFVEYCYIFIDVIVSEFFILYKAIIIFIGNIII